MTGKLKVGKLYISNTTNLVAYYGLDEFYKNTPRWFSGTSLRDEPIWFGIKKNNPFLVVECCVDCCYKVLSGNRMGYITNMPMFSIKELATIGV